MNIEVWKGDWGLPSVDPHCLAALAYCKFSNAPVQVAESGNPWRSPSGTFPVLKHGEQSFTKLNDIFSHLRKEHWGSDSQLSTLETADVVAFSTLIEEKLLPALLHLFWLDDKTYSDIIRPWYARALPFPLSLFVPNQKHKMAELRINLTKGGEHITDIETEAKVYREAKECMNILSYKLGTNQFMFGTVPSSLDALLFGFLSPLLHAPLGANPLQTHLQQCDNLTRLCSHIHTTYFSHTLQAFESRQRSEEAERKKQGNSEHADFPNRRRNMILAAAFALTCMMGYACSIGMIRVQVSDEEKPKTRQVTMS